VRCCGFSRRSSHPRPPATPIDARPLRGQCRVSPESTATGQSDGIEPKLGNPVVPLRVNVGWLLTVTGIEEEPIGPYSEDSRHSTGSRLVRRGLAQKGWRPQCSRRGHWQYPDRRCQIDRAMAMGAPLTCDRRPLDITANGFRIRYRRPSLPVHRRVSHGDANPYGSTLGCEDGSRQDQ
jgi:hypothetical protein